ncbi:hypothetical protein [Roseovarius salinarum]|uniref:hypothetical protein n=1 Tax=Roseovarius salinarum TaxID=1981892 RepID=UPI000C33984A|nr:hypothetical protein [Roseovarius salinarum]
MSDKVLATVRASAPRRAFGLGTLAGLGLLLLYMALAMPPANPVWRVVMVVLGVAALWLTRAMARATAGAVELTETELRDSDGTRIALIEEIVGLDRGIFAFKPSNGFLLRLARRAPRAWRPGLWWRLGRRVGVGGVTPGAQAKMMAEVIETMLATR